MKVTGLDGRAYSWNPVGNIDVNREVSSHHERCRILLKNLFPSERILEEVGLPGTKPMLYADFVLNLRKLVVEVHGPQHYKRTAFFHATERDFIEGKKNDAKKKEWCERNNFFYIELPHWEGLNEWRYRILNFGKTNSGKETSSDTAI